MKNNIFIIFWLKKNICENTEHYGLKNKLNGRKERKHVSRQQELHFYIKNARIKLKIANIRTGVTLTLNIKESINLKLKKGKGINECMNEWTYLYNEEADLSLITLMRTENHTQDQPEQYLQLEYLPLGEAICTYIQ